MYRQIQQCRACQGKTLEKVFSLGVQPLANDFCFANGDHGGFAPLEVMFCPECTLAQLSVEVDPKVLYSNYAYVTSSSDTMRRHFDRLFTDIASEGAGKTIVEIGSNDGACLNFAKMKHGFHTTIGIDPAANLAPKDQTIVSAFDSGAAAIARATLGGGADVILARHCFCHINDWREFMAGVEVMAGLETLVCIEVPYVRDLLTRTEFDTIYHEHTSYLSLRAMEALLKKTLFHIHRIIHYGIHGGCILIMLRHKDSKREIHLSAEEVMAEEKITVADWYRFRERAVKKIERLREHILGIGDHKIVCGFGASAKGTVWMNAMNMTAKEIKFVTDNTPHKPGKQVPGTDIPVIPQDELLSNHPDFALLWAWNYEREIRFSQRRWMERGGKFINPHEPEE